MNTFKCKVCGSISVGSKNKKYCSNACKQSQYRMIKHPFSGKMVKVKDNCQILVDCSIAVNEMRKLIDISDNDCWRVFIDSLIASGFRFPDESKSIYELQRDHLSSLVDAIPDKRRSMQMASVYVAKFSCGAIKVGVSTNPSKRLNSISFSSGRVLDEFDSIEMRRRDAFKVEAAFKSEMANICLNGEFFDCDYQLAKDKVYQYAETISFARLS